MELNTSVKVIPATRAYSAATYAIRCLTRFQCSPWALDGIGSLAARVEGRCHPTAAIVILARRTQRHQARQVPGGQQE